MALDKLALNAVNSMFKLAAPFLKTVSYQTEGKGTYDPTLGKIVYDEAPYSFQAYVDNDNEKVGVRRSRANYIYGDTEHGETRITLKQADLPVMPRVNDMATVHNKVYRVTGVSNDPAQITWVLTCRLET